MPPVKRSFASAIAVALVIVTSASVASARSNRSGRAGRGGATVSRRGPTSRGGVAVQPFEGGSGAAPLRSLVSRIVRGRGYRSVTSLPHYEGTGQYPTLAREHHLTALVTGDIEERGRWSSITFLVWNGVTGSVAGRWTASGPTAGLGRVVGNGFWQHLGPAVRRTEAPPIPLDQDQAPTMRIDASEPRQDEPLASR